MADITGTLGIKRNLTIGGMQLTDVYTPPTTATLKQLFTFTSNTYGCFREPQNASGYQVPVSKKFLPIMLVVSSDAVTGGGYALQMYYMTTDTGLDSATAPTSPFYVFSNTAGGANAGLIFIQQGMNYLPLQGVEMPATKYIGIQNGANSNIAVQLWGYEVDA
jgi:hypothetical protein